MTEPAIAIVQVMNIVGPLLVAVLYIVACSFFKEPNRTNFNAIMIAGAGAAYLNGGFGRSEFAFTALVTYCAYKGLRSYRFISVGWLLTYGMGCSASSIWKSDSSLCSDFIAGMRNMRPGHCGVVFCRSTVSV
jgi:Family of unknown function (DUF6010)